MSPQASVLIFAGLFLAGGAFSFWRQKLPWPATAALALFAALVLVTGVRTR